MKEVMNIETSNTMSSLEIAGLTGKDHDNVLKDIRRILDEAEIGHVQFNGSYLSEQNKSLLCYKLPRDICDLVVSGYSVKYRYAIIKRWHELEKPKTQLELAREQVALLERLETIETERTHLKITLDLAHDWSSIKRMDMRDKMAYDTYKLRAFSRANGYEIKRVFDQNYGEVNSYHRDVWLAVYDVTVD